MYKDFHAWCLLFHENEVINPPEIIQGSRTSHAFNRRYYGMFPDFDIAEDPASLFINVSKSDFSRGYFQMYVPSLTYIFCVG